MAQTSILFLKYNFYYILQKRQMYLVQKSPERLKFSGNIIQTNTQ